MLVSKNVKVDRGSAVKWKVEKEVRTLGLLGQKRAVELKA